MDSESPEQKEKTNWKQFLWDKKWVLLILIPLIITTIVRLQPMRLVPLENSAESNVMNYYRSQISAQVQQQFPNLPDEQKQELAEKKLAEFLEGADKTAIQNQIKQSADAIKARMQYDSGGKKYVYLGDIDSYYWLRMARNILEKGTQCDVIKDKRCYDSYTTAPNLREKLYDYYPIAIVIVYTVLKLFNTDMSIMQASFLTPLAFSLLLTIPLFLLLRRIGGDGVAVVGAVLVNVNPHVLTRTLGSDSDIVNMFFQALFLWVAVECFYAKKSKNKYIWAAIAGACLSVYSKFWVGWWYLADLFIASLVISAAYTISHNYYAQKKLSFSELKAPLKKTGLAALFFIAAIIVIYGLIFNSPSALARIVTAQFDILHFKVAAKTDYWPNVLTTVAEFNNMGIGSIMGGFGSFYRVSLFFMAVLGMIFLLFPSIKFIKKKKISFILLIIFNSMVYLFLKNYQKKAGIFLFIIPLTVAIYIHAKSMGESKEDEEFYPDAAFLLISIICMVFYFSTVGARFFFLMALPVSIFVSVFFVRTAKIIVSTIRSALKIHKIASDIAMAVIIFLFLLAPVRVGANTAQNYMPNVNDEWVAALEKIKAESRPDAIINSWWDFGHWFKYLADRRVTLDGSSQNSPQLHWLGKLLLASDENTSKGILRMLDCGANNAFDALNKKMNDTPYSIDILNKIIVQKKEAAEKTLAERGLNKEEIDEVLSYTHCNPPENFLITSQDMIGKGGVWAHFGSWNFKKAYLSIAAGKTPQQELINKFKEDYSMPEESTKAWLNELNSMQSNEQINNWIAPWPSYFSGMQQCEKAENNFVCGFNQGGNIMPFVINFEEKSAFAQRQDGGKIYPAAVAFTDGLSFELKQNTADIANIGMVVAKNGDNVYSMFTAPELTGSMFTRLFFFNGIGLKNFEKFYDTTSVLGERIITWKVVWE